MRLLLVALLALPLCGQMTIARRRVAAAAASAPTPLQAKICGTFGSPITCAFDTAVSTGQKIGYAVSVVDGTSTFTVSDNCNTSGTSNSYTTDRARNVFETTTAQWGSATVGANTNPCTVSVSYSGAAGSGQIIIYTLSGTSGIDVISTANGQTSPDGANAVSSSAATTTVANTLCYGLSLNTDNNSGALTVGTTLAWTLDTATGGFGAGIEHITRASAASVTATFGVTQNFGQYQTVVACYKP